MKTKFKISFSILFLWIAIGCELSFDPENCTGENKVALEPINVEGLNFEGCGFLDATNEQEYRVIIKSKAEFEKYINCSTISSLVDFNKYFILAGSYNHRQCAILDNQQVSICNDILVYNVNLREQDCFATTRVNYLVVIKNKYINLPVKFEVEFLN
jgi:hypothetical protein